MAEPLVLLDIKDGIARVTLNRPQKRNALTRGSLEEMAQAVTTAAADDSIRLLVLASAGPVFCAGMDLGEMEDRAGHPNAAELWQDDTRVYRDLVMSLLTLPVPVLAVVQGPAVAGGFGLVLACDLILMSDTAFFALPEPKRGITAAVVSPMLIYRAGTANASYLLLSGKYVSAQDAHRMGICHELSTDDQLAARERELTDAILSQSKSALATTKSILRNWAGPNLLTQIEEAVIVSAQARETPDAREGLQAFLQKRKPVWHVESK